MKLTLQLIVVVLIAPTKFRDIKFAVICSNARYIQSEFEQITANYHETSMVFLPYTDTVILLEPYCGTFTEPGLPVVKGRGFQFFTMRF